MLTPEKASEVLRNADLLIDAATADAAVDRVAAEITAAIGNENPLVLSVMGGAVVFSGQLLPRLRFPLDFDYMHATRYGNATTGSGIQWKVFPTTPLADRTVLVVDDILDEGNTMIAIRERLLAASARRFLCAVFADKNLGRQKPMQADFVGVSLPNRYVFGYGMDVKGAWRNLPAVYAIGAGQTL